MDSFGGADLALYEILKLYVILTIFTNIFAVLLFLYYKEAPAPENGPSKENGENMIENGRNTEVF